MSDKFEAYRKIVDGFRSEHRLRQIPSDGFAGRIDLSSNDYLGLAAEGTAFDAELRERFPEASFSSSASRLLSHRQEIHCRLESLLENQYGGKALIFNSGYHANVGIASSLAIAGTLLVTDKAIHASLLDGLAVGKAEFRRFRHNDMDGLRAILERSKGKYERFVVCVESVYSMDGDVAPLQELVEIKNSFPGVILYVDEAHAVGVRGSKGLGLAEELGLIPEIDILVGTFGKALASSGAFVVTSPLLRDFLVNTSRPLIFSTALPPVCSARSLLMMEKMLSMNSRRCHLAALAEKLRRGINALGGDTGNSTSQIIPLIIGDSLRAMRLSERLSEQGFDALPIRRPTVAACSERIRFSLNSSLKDEDIDRLLKVLSDEANYLEQDET